MVTWCDDERDTRASYGPCKSDESHPVISMKDMVKGIYETNNASLYNMGFNEIVYKETMGNAGGGVASDAFKGVASDASDAFEASDAFDASYAFDASNQVTNDDETKSEEKNPNLLANNKFADS